MGSSACSSLLELALNRPGLLVLAPGARLWIMDYRLFASGLIVGLWIIAAERREKWDYGLSPENCQMIKVNGGLIEPKD